MMRLLRRYFSRSVVIATGLVSLILIFSFLSPVLAAADSVTHFRFHLVFLLIFLLVFTALLGKRWLVIMGIFVAIAGAISIAPDLLPSSVHAEGENYQTLKLMQLNLLFMNRKLDAVAKLARERDVDVITLQEVNSWTGRVLSLLQQDYPYQIRCTFQAVGGIAVLSRLPIAQGISTGCLSEDGVAWMQVRLGRQKITVSSIHLHWPFPFSQMTQVERLENRLSRLPQPVILAGDFNAAPWSRCVNRLANASQTRVVPGLRFSFYLNVSGNFLPIGLPIDHVLLPEIFMLENIELGPRVGSDHYSVFADIAVPYIK